MCCHDLECVSKASNELKNQPTSEEDRDLCMYAKENHEDENNLLEELRILLSRASCQVRNPNMTLSDKAHEFDHTSPLLNK
jgi:hypothetical protein